MRNAAKDGIQYRWSDAIKQFAGIKSNQHVQDRMNWIFLGDAFVQYSGHRLLPLIIVVVVMITMTATYAPSFV